MASRMASGRDRARQPRQDPGEGLGLLAPVDLDLGDGLAVADRGEADDDDEGDDERIGRRRLDHESEDGDQAEDEEGAGEDPPCASGATLRGLGRSCGRTVGLAHVRYRGWRTGRRPSMRLTQYQRVIARRYFRTSRPSGPDQAARVPGLRGVVAALALDPVERLVGRGDELGGGPAVGREGRHADRRADRDRTALFADIGVVAERLEDPFRGPGRFVGVGLRQDDRELVAAVAGRDIRGAQGRPDELGGPGQDAVAEQVAERVVDELEVVEVEHQHAHRAGGRAGSARPPRRGARGGTGGCRSRSAGRGRRGCAPPRRAARSRAPSPPRWPSSGPGRGAPRRR